MVYNKQTQLMLILMLWNDIKKNAELRKLIQH